MKDETSLEYKEIGDYYYIYSKTSVDRTNDTWRIPSTSKVILSNKSYTTGFNFSLVDSYNTIQDKLYDKGNIVARIVPGMVVSPEMNVRCVIASKQRIKLLEPEYPQQIQIVNKGKSNGKSLFDFKFSRLGENTITIQYGKGKTCYLNFYVIEPLENIIKKGRHLLLPTNNIVIPQNGIMGCIVYGTWRMRNYFLPKTKGVYHTHTW